MIIRIILLLCISVLFSVSVYAENNVSLQVSQSEITQDESLDVMLQIRFDETSQIPDVVIPGIEYFSIFSQSQSEQLRQVNDVFERIWTLTLRVSPKEVGDFQLGPVTLLIDDVPYNSESHNIAVVPDSVSQQLSSRKTEIQEGLKPLKKPTVSRWLTLVLVAIFAGIFYLSIYAFFFLSRKRSSSKIPIKQKKTLKDELEDLQKQIPSLSEGDFFEILHTSIRNYISETYDAPNAHSGTYKELFPYIDSPKLQQAFHSSYIHEFNGKKTLDATKKKIIQEYLDIL